MGGSHSSRAGTEEERREREKAERLRQIGVFVPPTFAVNLDRDAETHWHQAASRTEARYNTEPPLSHVKRSQQDDASYRILRDYMTPGVWFQSVSTEATVLASLLYRMTDDGRRIESKQGRILVGKALIDEKLQVQLQGGTQGLPKLSLRYNLNDSVAVGLQANQQGQGMVSLQTSSVLQDGATLDLVSTMPWNINKIEETTHSSLPRNQTVFCSGAVGTGTSGWRVAGDATLDLKNLQLHNTRVFGSLPLQNDASSSTLSPVQLTCEMSESVSAVAISQRFLFDRVSFNLADDRAPRVQNACGWTLRIEQPLLEENVSDSGGRAAPRVIVGGAWQWNRALALKGTIQDETITVGLIGKRWKHPRLLCSLIGRYHWPSQAFSWVGLGVEIETGRLATGVASTSTISANETPPTKVTLPVSSSSF